MCTPSTVISDAYSACISQSSTTVNNWNSLNCSNVFNSYVYSCEYTGVSVSNYMKLQSDFSNFMQWYHDTYNFVSGPITKELIQICNNDNYPGICEPFLYSSENNNGYCFSKQTSDLTTLTDIQLCGCFTTTSSFSDYQNYTTGTSGCTDGSGTPCEPCTGSTCVVVKACDSLCNRNDVIQRAQKIVTVPMKETCPRNYCIIDNTTINIENSQIPGGVNFSTQCGGCGDNNLGCQCIVNGTNINSTLASIGVGVNFDTLCDSKSSVCIENGKSVPCLVSSSVVKKTDDSPNMKVVGFVGCICLLIVIVILIIVAVDKGK